MKTYFRILSYARPWSKILPGYIVFSLLSILFGLLNLTLLKPFFDVIFDKIDVEQLAKYKQVPEFTMSFEYLQNVFHYYMNIFVEEYGKFGSLIWVCIVIVGTFMMANLFRYLSALILAKTRAKIVKNIRINIFSNMTNMHIGFFTNQRKGDIMSRVTQDVQQIENSVANTLKVLFREPATVIVYFSLLFAVSYKLTLFTLILLPVSGFVISTITKRLKKTATKGQESLAHQLNILEESIGGIRVIKAFNAVNYINKMFSSEVKKYANIDISWSKKYELSSPVSEFLGAIAIAGILLYGGRLVFITQSLDASSFMMFIAAFTQILQPAKAISSAVSYFQRGLASGDRVFELIDMKPDIVNKPHPVILTSFENAIEFKNVSFYYTKGKLVLQNIDLLIEKGKTIALVGPSGGGKSTLANLVPRFYDPMEGSVLIDGVSLKDYELTSIRNQMGIVTQESILFNDTIFNNISFGIENPHEEDVIRVAKIANAHNFITEHDKGYQRMIGERGNKLSGGQKQRITIARALLKNPSILILDEATSALDSESEMLVQDAINKLMKDRTSLVIAHRLSTIQNADEIVVVDEGRIRERGTHEELILTNGIYKKLTEMQNMH